MLLEKPFENDMEILSCTFREKHYPAALSELSERPSILYYKGNIEILNQHKSVAIIGSRKISEQGRRFSYWSGKTAAEAGLNVVNGLALGCDSEALRGALENGGKCIAILPCGLDQIVPKSNERLAGEILRMGGCLLSEYKMGTRPERYRYIERDRLQSGVSQGVLVIEAGESSGTMHTVDFARSQARRLACYYSALLGKAPGNQALEMSGMTEVIKTETDLKAFMQKILQTEWYQQLTLPLE